MVFYVNETYEKEHVRGAMLCACCMYILIIFNYNLDTHSKRPLIIDQSNHNSKCIWILLILQ